MTPEQFELLQKAAGLLMAVVGAFGLVPLVNWLKAMFKIDGGKAQILAAVVATLVAILSLIVGGQLTPESVTEVQFVPTLLLVWAASQEIYKRLTASKEPIVPPIEGMPNEEMVEAAVERFTKRAG